MLSMSLDRVQGLETRGIETPGPISQMRKLRLTEAQPVSNLTRLL